jgi:hypothetical protein
MEASLDFCLSPLIRIRYAVCRPVRCRQVLIAVEYDNLILVGCILLRYVYTYTSQIHLRSQLRIYWCYFYSLCS